MNTHASLSELVSGVRFALALERHATQNTIDPEFQNDIDKAEASSHPKELRLYAENALLNCRNSVSKTILHQVSGLCGDHPLFDTPCNMITDESIAEYLRTLPESVVLVMLRRTEILVDKEHLNESIDELAKLSYRRLLSYCPDAEPFEVDMLDRRGLFEYAQEHFIWTRHIQKIEDFLKTALTEKQRDDLLATIGVDIFDEDYEDSLEEEFAPQLITEGLETFQFDNDWIDWTGWEPKDSNLDVFEALQYAYSKLTPELIRESRESFKSE